MRTIQRLGTVSAALAVGLSFTAGCGGGSDEAADIAPATKADTSVVCDAVEVGPFTRCKNFYEDYWPTIEKNLDDLYEQAKKIDGGRLVVWDWYELSPDVIAAFNKEFPDIKIETRGLTYNLPSAVISAKATGERNTDIVSGSITSMTSMYDQGFFDDVDWTSYGVPKEFFTVGAPNLLPDSFNGGLLNYNSDEVDAVPESIAGFDSPEWKGQFAIANYNAQQFAGYGMIHGEDKMVSLIESLKSNGIVTVANDPSNLLSSGDKPVVLAGQLFNPQPSLEVSGFKEVDLYAQFTGVNTDATNKPAAALWALWNAYDPDWLKLKLTDKRFASTTMPFIGLPSSVFDQATGLAKRNIDAWLTTVDKGWGVYETQDNRDKWNDLIGAADKALNG